MMAQLFYTARLSSTFAKNMAYSKRCLNALLRYHHAAVAYLHDGSMKIEDNNCALTITKNGKTTFKFVFESQELDAIYEQVGIQYDYIFDVIDKFLNHHLRFKNVPYVASKLITLDEYLRDEMNDLSRHEFFRQIELRREDNIFSLGGNRLECDIVDNCMIFTDDLVCAATNVVAINKANKALHPTVNRLVARNL